MKRFLLNPENSARDSYLWNMVSNMTNAFQSVLLLAIMTRTVGLTEAGIFSIAYANANLLLALGGYGMREFHNTDVGHKFSFSTYRSARLVTILAMLLTAVISCLISAARQDYSNYKTAVMILMCVWRAVDAFEDVYAGQYQSNDRLDVGAKVMALRMLASLAAFCAGLILLQDLLIALVIAIVTAVTADLLLLTMTRHIAGEKAGRAKLKDVFVLLKTCAPLCVAGFLTLYIGNAPKYAIDRILSDELQACYGFVAMPVFVIGLLNGFVFNPIMYKMSLMWQTNQISAFARRVIIQIGIVAAITAVCELGAFLLGIPVLSWLYNTDLTAYKDELLMLLLGGGFLSLANLCASVLTIMRKHRYTMYMNLTVAAVALFTANYFVEKFQLFGAAAMYVCLMALLFLLAGSTVSVLIMRQTKNEKESKGN